MTFSTREKQGTVQAEGWGAHKAGELVEAAAPAQSPRALKRARRATVPQQENPLLSSAEHPASPRTFPITGLLPARRRRGLCSK